MKLYLLPLLLAVLISCDKVESIFDNTIEDEIFLIPQGEHENQNGILFKGFNKDKLAFEAKFDKSAKYITKDPQNQGDINKLMGFSDCNSQHHMNSARFGWRWYDDQLQILAYIYDEGKMFYTFLSSVPMDKAVHYELEKTDRGYLFTVGNKAPVLVERKVCEGTMNYMLWPYFGGTESAPHDIKIEIKILSDY